MEIQAEALEYELSDEDYVDISEKYGELSGGLKLKRTTSLTVAIHSQVLE
mgnify:CR=1 FL=1